MTRYWGFWTRGKLDILRRYLDAFTTASSGQGERIYLDLFNVFQALLSLLGFAGGSRD